MRIQLKKLNLQGNLNYPMLCSKINKINKYVKNNKYVKKVSKTLILIL